MFEIRRDNFIFRVPKTGFKKYDVYDLNGKYLFSFGDRRYQQFKDKLGFWSHLDHNDKERRKRYYQRHGPYVPGVNPDSFSKKYLWPLK